MSGHSKEYIDDAYCNRCDKLIQEGDPEFLDDVGSSFCEDCKDSIDTPSEDAEVSEDCDCGNCSECAEREDNHWACHCGVCFKCKS